MRPSAFLCKRIFHQSSFSTLSSFIESSSSSIESSSTLLQTFLQDFNLFPNFITAQEEAFLFKQCDLKLNRLVRRKYHDRHFDKVIHGYRECTVSSWTVTSQSREFHTLTPDEQALVLILDRARSLLENNVLQQKTQWLPPHVLDLLEDSGIGAHVDHIEASGRIVAGLCLGSPAVMVFQHARPPPFHIKALLPNACLYYQKDTVRFDYTHAIPSDPILHTFQNENIPKQRRIVILLRDAI